MSQSFSFDDFYLQFYEQIMLAKDSETYGWEDQDFFTSVMLEHLEDLGETDSPVICPYRGYGLQLNAYRISEDYEEVDIYVSIFDTCDKPTSISRAEIDAALKRALQLFRKATNDLYTAFEKDNDTYEFAYSIHTHKHDIKALNVIALTNGTVKPIPLKDITIDDVKVSFSIWDIDRLYRCFTSGKMRETIEIDFLDEFDLTISCIENSTSPTYNVYLAIISGELLAKLYEMHGARLLERNVRSFLQVKGAVNKGIRDTLRDEPDMFLAYNNGISVTAEDVEIIRDDNGKPSIKKIRDMQIVNGGQTTASIYNVYKDRKISTDLSQVFIQMKISVIKANEQIDEIVPKISAYANTQNKIQMADFSANDPFHRKIEELSRIIWAPARSGMKPQNWFYERARGQYVDMQAREITPARKKLFKEQHPLFTKTDLAKYENTWDQLPYQVSEGAQKNFKKFTIRLNERGNTLPDQAYYENLIAKAILFEKTVKLVQTQQFGGYRANIVTYTIAFLSYKTAQRINLDSIWKEQQLSTALEAELIRTSDIVHKYITSPANGVNISEWCKNVKCWNGLKDIDYKISEELNEELIDLTYTTASANNINTGIYAITEEEKALITEASNISAVEWFALSKWSKETNNFQSWQRSIIFSVGSLINRGKAPSLKQAKQALLVYHQSKDRGFTFSD